MKKVAIATYQYNNYGTKLQNYALKKTLERQGFEVSSISIRLRKDTFRILAKLLLKTSWRFVMMKNRRFSRFGKKHLNLVRVSYVGLERLNNDFDYFIAGSDQIWNPKHLSTRAQDKKLFFLSFVNDKSKRIAYAPSFGVQLLTPEEKTIYEGQVDSFAYLSAREPSGAKIIKAITGRDADIVPDPTFLLSRSDWAYVTEEFDKKYNEKKYIAVYYLSDQPKENLSRIERYARDNNFEVVVVSGDLYTKRSQVPDPAEFVSIIKNAQAVFTDSFHACVFSIINTTPFIVRQRTDVKQFTRIENLLTEFKLMAAVDDNNANISDILESESFDGVNNRLMMYSQEGVAFLRKAMK